MKKFFAILAIATVTFVSCNDAAEGDAATDTTAVEAPVTTDSMPPVTTDTMTAVDSSVVPDSAK